MLNAQDLADRLCCENPACICHRKSVQRLTHCPGHTDSTPSLSVQEKDGKVLFHCFAGCTQEQVLEALTARGLWGKTSRGALGAQIGHAHTPGRNRSQKTIGAQEQPQSSINTHINSGLSLVQLASAKRIPIERLKTWGLSEGKYRGAAFVKVPYRDIGGVLVGVRYRISLQGDQFRWRSGDHPHLYGLSRLNGFPGDYVLLVEGESDCWTAWLHGIPCLGIPGVRTWRDEWAAHLKGKRVYLWREPDAAGTTLVNTIGQFLPDLRVITAPPGIKDLSALHLSGQDVKKVLGQLMKEATSFAQIREQQQADQNKAFRKREAEVLARLGTRNIGELMLRGLRQAGSVVHNDVAALVLILSTTRHFQRPVNLRLVGPSGTGKSSIVDFALKFLPKGSVLSYTRISPAALSYFKGGSLKGKVLFVAQGEGSDSAAYNIQMATDGSLSLLTTTKDKSSRITGQEIRIEGPVLFITTSITPESEEQSCSRIWEIALEADEQINHKIVNSCFAEELPGGDDAELLRDFMGVVSDRAKTGEPRLEPRFAEALAGLLEPFCSDPKVNRYAFHLRSAIKAANLCLPHPPELAGLEAYNLIYDLLAPVFSRAFSGMSPQIHKIISALTKRGALDKESALSANEIAKLLSDHVRTVQAWCKAGFDRGFLQRYRENRAKPFRYWGAQISIAESSSGTYRLPTPLEVESCMCVESFGVTAAHPHSSGSDGSQTRAQGTSAPPAPNSIEKEAIT